MQSTDCIQNIYTSTTTDQRKNKRKHQIQSHVHCQKIVPSLDQYKTSHNCNSPMYCLPKNIPDFRHGRPCWALPDRSPRPLLLYQECTSLQGQRSLRSTKRHVLIVHFACTTIKQNRAFSVVGPSVWNGLPLALRLHSDSCLGMLKQNLESWISVL